MSPPDPAAIWERVLEELRQRITPAVVVMWIEPARPVGIEDGRLVCVAPEPMLHWIGRRYRRTIAELVRSVSELDGVIFRLDPQNPNAQREVRH